MNDMWCVDFADTDQLPDGYAWLMLGDDYETAQPLPIPEAMRRMATLNAQLHPTGWVSDL